MLAYAASVGDADHASTTYQQAMDSQTPIKWMKDMITELKAHSENGYMEAGPEDEGSPTNRMQMGIR